MSDSQTPAESTGPEPWETVFDIVPLPVYIVDIATLDLLNVNRAMRLKTLAQPGRKCYQAIYGKDKPCSFCPIAELVSNPAPFGATIVFEIFNDFDDCWYQMQETLMDWPGSRIAKYSITVDVSKLKQTQNALVEAHAELALKNRELLRLSTTDSLTGLNNRRHLDEVLEQEVERANRYCEPLSVLIIDFDKFKSLNDRYGHAAGDLVLTTIADILRKQIRKVDTIGRWGGEEFMVLCPNTRGEEAVQLADKLRSAVEQNIFPVIEKCTCSVGVSQYLEGEAPEKMVARADVALYRAKEHGRNQVEMVK